jgi:hypothetical protein
LILRLNPAVRERERQRRADQLARLHQKVDEGNRKLQNSPRSRTATLLKKTQGWIKRYHFDKWLKATGEERRVVLTQNKQAREQAELLDDCHVIVIDLPARICGAKTVCERYTSLQKVERNIRTLKTGQLELRPSAGLSAQGRANRRPRTGHDACAQTGAPARRAGRSPEPDSG